MRSSRFCPKSRVRSPLGRTCDRRRQSSPAGGFTLIELTVVLAVIVTLALILTPSITNFINDSRVARARADIQTLNAAIAQFYKDNGFYPQWATSSGGGPGTTKLDLLVSPGNVPSASSATTWTSTSATATDSIADQLVTNAPGYRMKTATSDFGWNGPYLTSNIGADPWNNRYAINVGLIDPTIGTQTASGATKSAVWVISAGPNGQIETAYTQPITTAALGGDDIGTRVQ
ncbi:MAG TPA: prepilin-type N-terminal cleavage/methylation domain-containing protein [Vicinamibacterales bacterium]|nr:prepilin-type N-terminal cleavage/methylation domain-containing protein [Vicinamibacterales bacterium]